MLKSVVINPQSSVTASVIWLHGLGADGHDFEPIVPQLRIEHEPGVRFIFPHAPHRAITVNRGFVMRAWYDIFSDDIGARADAEGIIESQQQVTELVEAEIQNGIPASRIILAGFSQGGVIALGVATRFREALGGLMVLSSYVALPDRLPLAADGLPIFMAHGTQDAIVPFALGERSRDLLLGKGYVPQWHRYPIGHGVCAEEIEDIRIWLGERLSTLDA